jgi:NADH-quinone oxidoreductase subunit A
MIGRLVRPMRMDAEKATVYECGEPTIGSSWIQFDLRFYVVALLFVVFDVEMAFFFPWAVVFGKANALAKADLPAEQRIAMTQELQPKEYWSTPHASPGETPKQWQEFEDSVRGTQSGPAPKGASATAERTRQSAKKFAETAFLDILVFFGVLLVGFAYLWRRGDLDWVRSIAAQKQEVNQASETADQKSQANPVAV